MKKTTKLLTTLCVFLSLIFITGCEKNVPTVQPEKALSISLVATPSNIAYGKTSVIKIIVENADSTTSDLPGALFIKGSCDKSVKTPILYESKDFYFRSYLAGKVTTQSIRIEVGLPDPPKVVLSPSCSISRGKETTFTWNVTGIADSLTSNFPGVSGLSGSVKITPTETTTITVDAYGKGGVTTSTVTITVTEPTDQEILSSFPMKEVRMESSLSLDGPWRVIDRSAPCLQDDRYIFKPDGIFINDDGEILCEGENQRFFYSTWELNGNQLTGFGIMTVLSLDEDQLVYFYETGQIQPDGITCIPAFCKVTLAFDKP